MLLFKKVKDLQQHLSALRQEGKSIGFVPTMGALHEGHISLLRFAIRQTDCAVCSIFVNPAQFNDNSDLLQYPRTPGADTGMLVSGGCHVLFMPSVDEVYPKGLEAPPSFDLGYLSQPMEGKHRPGHFEGVTRVVKRLLDIVEPDKLYMGQKDFQQFSIVASMLQQMNSTIQLIRCPVVREKDGLAMSSRNVRLTEEQRKLAPLICQTLLDAKRKMPAAFPKHIEKEAMKKLASAGMKPEYFEIVDGTTLLPVEVFEDSNYVVACTAVQLGEVRLIDNLILKEEG